MFMTLATSLVVLFNCYATADIWTKFLQQYFLFFIVVVVVIPGQWTIGPSLVLFNPEISIDFGYFSFSWAELIMNKVL